MWEYIKRTVGYLYHHRFLRYLFVGVSTFVLDFGLLYILHGRLKLNLPLSVTLSYVVTITYNFTLNLKWTFDSTEKTSLHRHLIPYLVLLAINYIFNVVFISLLSRHTNYLIAKFIAASLQIMWTYPIYRFVIFNTPNSGAKLTIDL